MTEIFDSNGEILYSNAKGFDSLIDMDTLWEDMNLTDANLENINAQGLNCMHINFSEANLKGADLYWAIAAWANFSKADLTDCFLMGADLKECKFSHSVLDGANLGYDSLGGNTGLFAADLTFSSLINTNLEGANLQSANLGGAKIRGTNFKATNLLFASLLDIDFDRKLDKKTSFEGAKYNPLTVFPKGFDPEDYGMMFVSLEESGEPSG